MSVYVDREQTDAKHFILRRYLQVLAFKVMHAWDTIAYIDGFSGPWESKGADFSDTSFMIAINVLEDAQARVAELKGCRPRVKCFFSENDRKAYAQLDRAVAPHHRPEDGFEIKTYCGDFEDAVDEIRGFAGNAFPLIFIDPTGWTGYPFAKIKPLFAPARCEVLINFMYDFVNRAAAMRDPKTISSFDPILGGPGWTNRLDASLERGAAVEKLFRDTLKVEGGFAYVVSTRIDKSTADRPHFYLAYGTKSPAGLRAFRQTEYEALRYHAKSRATAKERKREERTGSQDMFAGQHVEAQEATIDELVEAQKVLAAEALLSMLGQRGSQRFAGVVNRLLEDFMLRETDVKNICVTLGKAGKLENTWGSGNRKPVDDTDLRLGPSDIGWRPRQ